MKNKSRVAIFDHLLMGITLCLVFLLIPGFMISNSPTDFAFLDFSVLFSTSIVLFTISLAIYVLTYWLLYLVTRKSMLPHHLVIGMFFWALLAGLLFPVTESVGLVEPIKTPTNFINLGMVLLLSIAMTYFVTTKARKYVYTFSAVFIIINIVTTVSNFPSTKQTSVAHSHIKLSELSDKSNIIVLSMDALSGPIINTIFKNDPELKASFKDFTLFENAFSAFPATRESIMAEMYGSLDFKQLSTDSTKLTKELSTTPLLLNNKQADIYTYGQYNMFSTTPEKAIPMGGLVPKSKNMGDISYEQSLDFFQYVIVRLGTKKFLQLIDGQFEKWFFAAKSNIQNERPSEYSQFLDQVRKHKGPNWDVKTIVTLWGYRNWMEKLHIAEKQQSIRFLHFSFTHFPVDFDENCQYRSNDRKWFMLHQNEKGLTNEAKCALKTMSDFLQKLKSLGVYDNSLVILKSDHGMPANYFSNSPYNLRFNGHEIWGYDRYRPLLMVKGKQQRHNTLQLKKETALLSDLATTVCQASNIEHNCEQYPGKNLLSDSLPVGHELFNLYITRSSRSSYRYNDLMGVTVSRSSDVISSLQSQGVEVSSPKSSLADNPDKLAAQQLSDLTSLHEALQQYHQKYGSYPLSQGWDGLYTHIGKASENWIPGLVPEFIATLPRDPRRNTSPYTQYLYRSNGNEFKLISENGFLAGKVNKKFIDPQRVSHAFGFWSSGARNW